MCIKVHCSSQQKEKKNNVNVFYIDMRCLLTTSYPWARGHGGRKGFIAYFHKWTIIGVKYNNDPIFFKSIAVLDIGYHFDSNEEQSMTMWT